MPKNSSTKTIPEPFIVNKIHKIMEKSGERNPDDFISMKYNILKPEVIKKILEKK